MCTRSSSTCCWRGTTRARTLWPPSSPSECWRAEKTQTSNMLQDTPHKTEVNITSSAWHWPCPVAGWMTCLQRREVGSSQERLFAASTANSCRSFNMSGWQVWIPTFPVSLILNQGRSKNLLFKEFFLNRGVSMFLKTQNVFLALQTRLFQQKVANKFLFPKRFKGGHQFRIIS